MARSRLNPVEVSTVVLMDLPSGLSTALAREARALGLPVDEARGLDAWTPGTGDVTYIVISSLEPPEEDGLKVIRLLRRNCPRARLVAVSSTSSLTKMAEAVQVARPTTVSQILVALGLSPPRTDLPGTHMSLDRAIWEFLNQSVQEAGSISGAARRLRLDRTSLKRMLRKVPAIEVADISAQCDRLRHESF